MDFFLPLAHAQPPPDFLYQAGSQAIQFSSILFVGMGFVMAWFRSLWVRWFALSFFRRGFLVALGVLMIIFVLSGTMYFSLSDPQASSSLSARIISSESTPRGSVQGIDGHALEAFLHNGSIRLIDVREDEERAFGFIPGSEQIRMADIFAGDWKNFSKNEPLYFHCATGTRSHQVAKFLSQKGFVTYFLNERLEEWIDQDRTWSGELPFRDEASKLLKKGIQSDAAYELWNAGSILVDVRSNRRQAMKPVEKSFSLPVIDLSSDELKAQLKSFPSPRSVLILTDSIALSSFSAFLAASKLDELGYRIEGIIYEPQKFLNLL